MSREEAAAVISRTRQWVQGYMESLPNFTCRKTVRVFVVPAILKVRQTPRNSTNNNPLTVSLATQPRDRALETTKRKSLLQKSPGSGIYGL